VHGRYLHDHNAYCDIPNDSGDEDKDVDDGEGHHNLNGQVFGTPHQQEVRLQGQLLLGRAIRVVKDGGDFEGQSGCVLRYQEIRHSRRPGSASSADGIDGRRSAGIEVPETQGYTSSQNCRERPWRCDNLE